MSILESPNPKGSTIFSQSLAYVLPTIPVSFLLGAVSIIQGIYAKHFGLSLTTIGSILLVARLFDAVTDPAIGYLSDRYYDRNGSRKGFVISGAILFIICSYFLFAPNGMSNVSPPSPVSSVYFLVWFMFFYLAWTIFEIPHLALGSELSNCAQDKNVMFSVRAIGWSLGTMLFYAVPLLPIFETHEFTPLSLVYSVFFAGALMFPTLYFGMKVLPDRTDSNFIGNTNKLKRVAKIQVSTVLSQLMENKPFVLIMNAYMFVGTGVGMTLALLFIFADSYLDLGARLPVIYMLVMGLSIFSIGFWYKLADLFGGKVCWSSGVSMALTGILGISLLSPEHTGWLALLLLQTLITCGWMAMDVSVPSLVSNAVDYASLKCRGGYSATYFSVYTLLKKVSLALGGAIGLIIAGNYGFDATSISHTKSETYGLHLAISYLPAIMIFISLIFIVMIPLNTRRNKIIQRRLEANRSRTDSIYKSLIVDGEKVS